MWDQSTLHPVPPGVNPDLQEERERPCSFSTRELTHFLDGGKEKTEERKALEAIFLDGQDKVEPLQLEGLGSVERHRLELARAVSLFRLSQVAREAGLNEGIRAMFSAGLGGAIMKDGNPLNLHFVMFIPTLLGQGTMDQVGDILGSAWELGMVGTYAQTELGHGTFIRGLELTATYQPKEQEWELHSPSLTSYKWWPGGLGQTASHAVVMARLVTQGQDRGVHPFLVRLRHAGTHRPLPGVIVGEIGPKLGMNSNNQGFLGFVQHRVPRSALLARNSRVEEDGTYVKPPKEKMGYATMVFVRTAIGLDIAVQLRKAVTIAVRYSAVRRQGEPRGDGLEPRVLDYRTQQAKVLPPIALSLGLHLAATAVWDMYNNVQVELEQGNYANLASLHAEACAIKVIVTSESARAVDQLRRACGGHGFMSSSNLPCISGMVTAACTYEGENTVLLLQVARYLVKTASQASCSSPPHPSCSYLDSSTLEAEADLASDRGLAGLFDQVARGEVSLAARALETKGWEDASILLTQAAVAHSRRLVISQFLAATKSSLPSPSLQSSLHSLLSSLLQLLAITWILDTPHIFLRHTQLDFPTLDQLVAKRDSLLILLRPQAVSIVDSFDFRDEVLDSSLGSWDGWVYHRLFQAAVASPLNQQEDGDGVPTVNQLLQTKAGQSKL